MRKIVGLLLTLLFWSILGQAKNYYTCGSCGNAQDWNDGTLARPFRTLQKGVDAVQAGDTLWVMNGVYEVSNNDWEPVMRISKAGTASAWITIKNYPGHSPFIKAGLALGKWSLIKIHPSAQSTPAYISIEGLRIQGNRTSYTIEDAKRLSGQCATNPDNSAKANGQGINIVGAGYCYDPDVSYLPIDRIPHHIRIKNCTVFDCVSSGIAAFRSDEITIENNTIYNNCWYTTNGTSAVNIYQSRKWNNALVYDTITTTDYRIIIRNNRIFGNGNLVKPSFTSCIRYDGNGIIVDDNINSQKGDACNLPTNIGYTGRTLIANNVIYGNGGSGIHLFSSNYIDVYHNTLYKNTVVNNLQEIYFRKCVSARIKNNIFYSADFPGRKVNNIFGTKLEYDYNIHYSNTPANYLTSYKGNGTTETHNIEFDPRFAINPIILSDTLTLWTNMPTPSSNIGEFRLTATSSGIFNATQLPIVPTDFFGTNRQNKCIGAYEFTNIAPVLSSNVVPDYQFRSLLISKGYDVNQDANIQANEIGNEDTLVIKNYGLSDITGIEKFQSLKYLDCSGNRLTNLDSVKREVQLQYLDCSNNKLSYLDLSNNPVLSRISCFNNQLSGFVFSKTKNTTLRSLIITNNKLTKLDLKTSTFLDRVWCFGNPSLETVCVADLNKANTNINFRKDPSTVWATNCNILPTPKWVVADSLFRIHLLSLGIDRNNNNVIEATEVTEIDTLISRNLNIKSLAGIESFVNLVYLDCSFNKLTNLDSLAKNIQLKYLDCSNNSLTRLDLFPNPLLSRIFCHNNQLTTFKVSKNKNTTLRTLIISNNKLSELNLKTSTFLDKLFCHNNALLSNICVADTNKAKSSVNYRKDLAAKWTTNCGVVFREAFEEFNTDNQDFERVIYPNPSIGMIHINTANISKIVVRDIAHTPIRVYENLSQNMLEVSLPSGVYIVEISDTNSAKNYKIVIQ